MRSKFEERVFSSILEVNPRAEYETQRLKYPVTKVYIPDVVIPLPDGTYRYIEIKGRFLSSDRSKSLSIREHHPGIDLRFVFQKDQPLSKGSKTLYSEWCSKKGFLFTIGTIPDEWLL